MTLTTPPARTCQVQANDRVTQPLVNSRVFQVPADE